MKKTLLFVGVALSMAFSFTSCGSKKSATEEVKYLELFSPEESGLNLVKITDEANGNVIASGAHTLSYDVNYTNAQCGFNKAHNIRWGSYTYLQVSPDGNKIAYLTRNNGQDNVMVRSTNSQGIATQRTFRNVDGGFTWANDGRIYFGDYNSYNNYISSVDAEKGSVMSQHTNGNVNDTDPAMSKDGSILYFTRWNSSYGPSIWALNKTNSTLSSCSRGFNVCPVPDNNNAFYCCRNNTSGRSEIWYVDYVNGEESVILSDINHGFTSPKLSPDGKWLLVVGNATSSISKKENTDIFVVRTDGTQLTQLTFHPETDISPVWSRDGQYIFFISSRGNKDRNYNIWRMNFQL